MTSKNLSEITMTIWGAMGIALAALFISTSGQVFSVFHMITAILLVLGAVAATGFIWQWGGVMSQQTKSLDDTFSEKAKRERIEQVLRNLSNAELVALKKRLANNEIDDDLLDFYLDQEEAERSTS
ncbi:MAG: hypothetical protein KC546_11940 [Anaerolineae bacterium]|nr:hypothetical protein [Anaerolineae bacterium]MCA9896338.1 hypothetical protein [Anaerolineae bacterium]